jgi:hypothetical protein
MLELARVGLASPDRRAERLGRSLLDRVASGEGAPAYAVYWRARQVERERGMTHALPLYREALDRDPALADAALRTGMFLASAPRTREDGVSSLKTYLRLAPSGGGSERARHELARLGHLTDR